MEVSLKSRKAFYLHQENEILLQWRHSDFANLSLLKLDGEIRRQQQPLKENQQ